MVWLDDAKHAPQRLGTVVVYLRGPLAPPAGEREGAEPASQIPAGVSRPQAPREAQGAEPACKSWPA